VHFIDCDVMLGRPRVPEPEVRGELDDLTAEMARLDVRQAWVRHRACEEVAPEMGNDLLLESLDGRDGFVPVAMVKPEGQEGSFDPARDVPALIARGMRAAWAKPAMTGVPLQPWCYGKMLAALEAHRMPLVLRYSDVPPADLYAVTTAFPALPIVLAGVMRAGRHRVLYPLLEAGEGIHLCCSPPFTAHGGLEDLVRQFGSRRILFGTGFPTCEGGASVAQVMYADLGDEDKRNIAYRNAERLVEGVCDESR